MGSGQVMGRETVFLLHGLGRSSRSLYKMELALRAAGFATCNIGYPSRRYSVEELTAKYVIPEIRKRITDDGPISFVSHSMGGIIVRQIRRTAPDIAFGRVVMLGPPNHGSELTDLMRTWPVYRWINGPAGQQLGTEPGSIPNRLGPATFEVGVIAGSKPFLEPFKHHISGPSDGKVSTESAKLANMSDYVALPVTHALMMRHPEVMQQTITFLQTGRFTNDAGMSARGKNENGDGHDRK